ncbi:MAG: thrombospondin type 3 repeat-containing protein, partial [Deltaproteobacteria bacterium]|nr:thrombospondin type 3 repeat-containing protein [Deltaproteobacteria bacterium]
PQGKVCTQTCLQECPQGWDCVQVDTGTDPVFICLPRHLWICRPCTSSDECSEGLPPGDDRCVTFAAEGAFCGGACAVDGDCPAGFHCEARETVEGGLSDQCVPPDLACACTPKHTAAGSTTTCSNDNDFGSCPGDRSCGPEGLGPCEGPVPAAEACNGEDDDCDGDEDEDVEPVACVVPATGGRTGGCPGLTACVDGAEVCEGDPPSMEECNGKDDDCDGVVDDGFTDTDGDGDANCMDPDDDGDGVLDDVDNCPLTPNPEQGDVNGNGLGDACDADSDGDGDLNATDCAPLNPSVHHGAAESCLTEGDDNCNDLTNEENAAACTPFYLDTDGDGWGVEAFKCLCAPSGDYDASLAGDCAPDDAGVFPGAGETCTTASDDDCDGNANEEGAADCVGYFLDEDQDGFGAGDAYCLCAGSGKVNTTLGGDCQDGEPAIFPGAEELCDGVDNNCNGVPDETFPDSDGDGPVDCLDPDDDNDGVPDLQDCQPYNPGVPSCVNKECGDDGCGGSCGVCPGGSTCTAGKCTCVPDCTGKQCGSDGCGGSCGSCPPSYACQDGTCVCLPQCQGKECGANGCGGSCGTCPPGHLCQAGWCICQPSCVGKQCGSDGCGGDCGTCAVGYTCNASGKCEPPQTNPCGSITWAGTCTGLVLKYCHAPGNSGIPCTTPPSCQLFQGNCDTMCMLEGWFGGFCECGVNA